MNKIPSLWTPKLCRIWWTERRLVVGKTIYKNPTRSRTTFVTTSPWRTWCPLIKRVRTREDVILHISGVWPVEVKVRFSICRSVVTTVCNDKYERKDSESPTSSTFSTCPRGTRRSEGPFSWVCICYDGNQSDNSTFSGMAWREEVVLFVLKSWLRFFPRKKSLFENTLRIIVC